MLVAAGRSRDANARGQFNLSDRVAQLEDVAMTAFA